VTASLLAAFGAAAADDPVFIGKLRNFTVSPDFYPPPHERQMKSQLRSQEAQPLPDNRFLVTGVRLETFKPTGERELNLETPGCIYDAGQKLIESTNDLKVATVDGKFSLRGRGFFWQQTNSVLLISNAVHTYMDAALFATGDRAGAPAGQPIEIDSGSFEYRANDGLGKFGDGVRAYGTNFSLASQRIVFLLPFRERQLQEIRAQEQVRIHYSDLDAEGGEAIYNVAPGTARMTGSPKWRTAAGHEGSADLITIDRASRVLMAEGNGRLKMVGNALTATPFQAATTKPATTAATNHFVHVTANRYEFHTNRVVFQGAVQVQDVIGAQPQGTMQSDSMEVAFAGRNDFQRLTAHGNVRIDQPEVSFKAGHAEYVGTNGILELTDNPRWSAGERSGSATSLRLDSNRKEMAALGSACLLLPAGELANSDAGLPRQAGQGPRKPAFDKTAVAIVCADNYFLNETGARFVGGVHIDHPQIRWTSENLIVVLPAVGGRVEKMVAERDVRFELTGENGQVIRGRGEQATYGSIVTPLGTNDILRLTGNPVLTTTNGTFRGNVIVLDVSNQRLIAPESYRIEAPATFVNTNLLRLPQNRILR
jgi:lipopolysaccharide export system protein LptA